MEFFGFACGNPAAVASFPFSSDPVLKGFPEQLKEHQSFLSVPFSSYDFVPVDLSALYQGAVDSYHSTLQTPVVRSIGAGIVAAAVIYCAWKVTVSWNATLSTSDVDLGVESNKDTNMKGTAGNKSRARSKSVANKQTVLPPARRTPFRKINSDVPAPEQNNTGSELAAVSENFQRQLMDALCRLDDVRFRLKELESERELLNAEIELRKKITQRLHVENSTERERRQQAELKMEMMEIENSQLRQLRRELSLKINQVEKLEKFIKEKDELQMKLFEDNVVLPRAVAEARAKEFGTLQARVHQLQSEVNATKRLLESNQGSNPTKSVSSAWPKDVPLLLNTPTANEVPDSPKPNILSETSIVLPGCASTKGPNTKRNLAERPTTISRSQVKMTEKSPKINRSRTSPELHMRCKIKSDKTFDRSEECLVKETKQVSKSNMPSTTSLIKTDDHGSSLDTSANKNVGVFAHLKAFINGFRDSSSESECANIQESSPGLNEQVAVVECEPSGREDNQDYPLSDEQSSVFMSASGGSVTSDSDHHGDPTRAASRSSRKKMISVKRFSKYKRDRRRDQDKSSRRKLACHLIPGNTSVEDALDAVSDSSDWSHRSTLKNFPTASRAGGHSPQCSKCSGSSKDGRVSTLESSEENSADSGDSWIVITPANS